jgi:hypothetical protein
MTSSPRSALVLVSAALLVACGGRSQLRDSSAAASGSGGAGPTTSSVTTTGGGGFGGTGGFIDVGGSGGMLSGCVVDGEPIGLAGTDGYRMSDPVFVVPVQVGITTLVAGWQASEGPMSPPIELRHTSFQPWGVWPANGTLGPSYLAEYDGALAFYAAPSFTDFNVVFAAPPPGMGLKYLSHLTPGSGALGTPEPLGAGGGDEQPCFLERGADPHVDLLGFSTAGAGVYRFNILRRDDAVAGSALSKDLGCAIDPIVAAAAPFGEEFFVAFSGGGAFGGPGCSTTASVLFSGRVTKQGTFEGIQEIDPAMPNSTIKSVKLVPRVDGAWLAWTDTLSGLHIARLDPTGKLAAPPTEVSFFGDLDTLSATSLGDRLALAWSRTPADANAQIHVNVVSTTGNVDADVSINLGGSATSRTAILGSPSNTSLLLGWSEAVSPGPQIRLARLACSLP